MTSTPGVRAARPPGVAVVAIFLLLDGLLGAIDVLASVPWTSRRAFLADVDPLVLTIVLAFAALQFVAALGLWRGSQRAWVLAMLLMGVGLVAALILWWNGHPSYPSMAIEVVIAFYLNQGVVREYFRGRGAARPEADRVVGARRP
jgi:hypothetical protein